MQADRKILIGLRDEHAEQRGINLAKELFLKFAYDTKMTDSEIEELTGECLHIATMFFKKINTEMYDETYKKITWASYDKG